MAHVLRGITDHLEGAFVCNYSDSLSGTASTGQQTDFSKVRNRAASQMTSAQIAKAQRMARERMAKRQR
jgi:hypothetical protein